MTCQAVQFCCFPKEGHIEDGAVGGAFCIEENGRRGVRDGDLGCAGRAVLGDLGRQREKMF